MKTKNLIIIFFVFLVISVFFWQGIYLPKTPDSAAEEIFIIKKGEGTREISLNLEKQDLIKWGVFFRIYAFTKGVAKNLQAGEYLLSSAMTIPEITKKFVLGKIIKIEVTIPEGFNISQIEERLVEKELVQKPEIKTQNSKIFKKEFQFLENIPDQMDLEGFLFPDTYQLSQEAKIEDIIRKMLSNFDKKLTPDLRTEIKRQEKTIFEIITMASLIEKEVRSLEDKKLVSGVLWKRLENKVPLQVCATITYITGKRTTKISIEEIKIDSPYNTYKYRGLPLGPICNPGLESIIAAIYPEDSQYWYYLSTPEGETIFSKTLKDHNLARDLYLK